MIRIGHPIRNLILTSPLLIGLVLALVFTLTPIIETLPYRIFTKIGPGHYIGPSYYTEKSAQIHPNQGATLIGCYISNMDWGFSHKFFGLSDSITDKCNHREPRFPYTIGEFIPRPSPLPQLPEVIQDRYASTVQRGMSAFLFRCQRHENCLLIPDPIYTKDESKTDDFDKFLFIKIMSEIVSDDLQKATITIEVIDTNGEALRSFESKTRFGENVEDAISSCIFGILGSFILWLGFYGFRIIQFVKNKRIN